MRQAMWVRFGNVSRPGERWRGIFGVVVWVGLPVGQKAREQGFWVGVCQGSAFLKWREARWDGMPRGLSARLTVQPGLCRESRPWEIFSDMVS